MVASRSLAPSGAPVRYDEREWPFVLVTFPPRELNDDEFQENLRELDKYGERGERFGFILDTRGAPNPNAARRRTIAEYWDACLRRHGETFIGTAIVMTSPAGRAVFKAILWLRSSSLLLIPVATPEEGLQQLRAAAVESQQRITKLQRSR